MTPAAYLLGFFLLGCIIAVAGLAYLFCDYRRTRKLMAWRKIHIDPEGRGPNADDWYWAPPPHEGHEVHITDEDLLLYKVRASHNLQRWHTYERT